MSGFIHITQKTPAWHIALRLAVVVAAVIGAGWYALSDEGLPIAPPSDQQKAFVKAAPLPAPPPVESTAMGTSSHDDDSAPAAPSANNTAARHDADDDFAARNAGIDASRLTATHPLAARTLLSEVVLQPGTHNGFVVAEVLPESRYERMGLRPGDVIYTLDTPAIAKVDESSMISLMQQTEIELDVYRAGTLTRLHASLAQMENGDVLPP